MPTLRSLENALGACVRIKGRDDFVKGPGRTPRVAETEGSHKGTALAASPAGPRNVSATRGQVPNFFARSFTLDSNPEST